MKHLFCGSLLLGALLSTTAAATTISYSLTSLGGSSFQYDYTLSNDTLGFEVDQFSIYFDLGLYENLVVTASPADWDSIVLQPDAGLPDERPPPHHLAHAPLVVWKDPPMSNALLHPFAPPAKASGSSMQPAPRSSRRPSSKFQSRRF